VGKGEEPIDFGNGMSQTSGITQQMNDLMAENAGSFQKQISFEKLNKFALGIDVEQKMGYNGGNSGGSSTTSSSSNSGLDIGELNPIRYRGYYYDVETNYYYLQTRYYSPEWRRFINADCLFIAGNPITGSNMYGYCNGNPVMLVDPDGMSSQSVSEFWQLFGQVLSVALMVGVAAGKMIEVLRWSVDAVEKYWSGIDANMLLQTANITISMIDSGYKLLEFPDGGYKDGWTYIAPSQAFAFIKEIELVVRIGFVAIAGTATIFVAGLPSLITFAQGILSKPPDASAGLGRTKWMIFAIPDWITSIATKELRGWANNGSGFMLSEYFNAEWGTRGDFGLGVYPWIWVKR